MRKQNKKETGFTLIELLVVVAIIAVLTGLLSVGLKQVKILSWNLRQKAVMKSIETGLELFSKDFDGYPDSSVLPDENSPSQTCGAQHLAEALVGRDQGGIEPRTGWYAPDDTRYKAAALITGVSSFFYDISNPASKSRRRGPFFETKQTEVRTIFELWAGNNGTSQIYDSQVFHSGNIARFRAPVFLDIFRRHRVALPGGEELRVGMPILYFKYDPTATLQFRLDPAQDLAVNPTSPVYRRWNYNFLDNLALTQLPLLSDPPKPSMGHYVDLSDATKQPAQVFYEQITQTADVSRKFYRPYNPSTYLLISAGWDGIYGNKDDITNFNY